MNIKKIALIVGMIVTALCGFGIDRYVSIYKNEKLVEEIDYDNELDDVDYEDLINGRRVLFHPDQKMWGNGTEAPFVMPEREPGPFT